jgi:multisubunit Na+/H+ antiporter MnhE subunit
MKVLDWFIGIGLWFARLGERILMWFLHNWAIFAGLGCAALVLISHWVALTITNRLAGLHAPLFGYKTDHAASPLLSWGVAAALLIAVSALACRLKLWRSLSIAGAALLLLTLGGLLQVAVGEPDLLKEIGNEESQWAASVNVFQLRYLPVNQGVEPDNASGPPLSTSIVTVWDRLIVARYFMGRGWYLTVMVGLLAFFYGRARLTPRGRARLTWWTVVLAVCLAAIALARPLAAQLAVARGQIAEAEGKPALAIEKYREAMRLDDWFAIHAALYVRIGAIDFSFGRTDTLEFGLYHSQLLFSQKNYSPAIQELEGLFPKAGSQSKLLQDLLADRWTAYGTALYAKGAVAAAIPAWQKALAHDRSSWLAGFSLSRAYFEVGRYQDSIDLVLPMTKLVRDPEFRSALDTNLGDDYARIGDLAQAKLAYRHSYLIDYVLNWRGLSDMIGAQNRISLEMSD